MRAQTCQPLIKENLGMHENKFGDSTKSSETFFAHIMIKQTFFA